VTERDAPPRTLDVRMPQLGESVEAGTIVRWLKSVGDPVAADEPLYEVSSDKAAMEVPSLSAGVVLELLAAEGEEVAVGAVVARVGTPAVAADTAQRERLSPLVRRLLREHGISSRSITGSAEGGRITKHDVRAYLESNGAAAAVPDAREVSRAGSSRRVPLSPLRARAAERLAAAQKSAVNVFSVIEIDLENVHAERVRRGYRYLPFVAHAVVDALQANPLLNASFDETTNELVLHDEIDLGIAVDLAETGLVVPVIQNAGKRTLDDLAAEIARLAAGARTGKLRPEDYASSTFTISNNGGFGTLLTAPVINAPNVAIVSTDAVEQRAVVINNAIAIRRRMYFCMTWDHRAFDGSTAARFLAHVKRVLEAHPSPSLR
jgi:pyruvate/2-oxoglutarate dehydrogenase complex dihydrolipoamide acyltransferase (E2) component